MNSINLDNLTFNILGQEYPLPLSPSKGKTKNGILMYSTLLFSVSGYEGVSVKDIANMVKIKPASLYNHFPSKEVIWEAVVAHTQSLFILYFDALEEKLSDCDSAAEMLEVAFREPKLMNNSFTCFAFNLLVNESTRNPLAWSVVHDTFYVYAIGILTRQFARVTDEAEPLATMIVFSSLTCISLECQRLLGRDTTFNTADILSGLEALLKRSATKLSTEGEST